MNEIKHVAVVGGGIMGGGIAALFANERIPVSVFDLDVALSRKCVDALTDPSAKIPLLYTPGHGKYIAPFAISQYAGELGKSDMIIEVVPEVMKIKKAAFQEIDKYRKPGSIVCTNTSGLSIAQMIDGCSEDLLEHFIGTHFFNPVRYLPLVELIPGSRTRREVVDLMRDFYTRIGKKPVLGRDTPNFIANRIGVFQMMKVLRLMEKYSLTVEQVDMVTGPPLANPKTATFRLGDMVGIDTLYHAALNQYENCPKDEARETVKPPAYIERLVKEKKLGDKTGSGFYAKNGKAINVLDFKTWEYRPKTSPRSDVVKAAKGYGRPQERIKVVIGDSKDPVSLFAKEAVLASAAYALNRVGEVAEDLFTIDNAMKWGFAKEVGPIEILDHIGLEKSAEMMQDCGIAVPALLKDAIATTGQLCDTTPHETRYFDGPSHTMKSVPARTDVILLPAVKDRNKVVRENLSARLIDLDDGVLLLEFDARMVPSMNPIDDYVISMMSQVFREIPRNFRALVIGNQAPHFCAGAQLQMLLELSKARRFDDITMISMALQTANLALYHADFPVVTAPHGMTLGGGMEVTLAGQTRVACAELYGGLVEVGVGVVPAGGGCLQLLAQMIDSMAKSRPGPLPPVLRAFDLIGYGKVSKSAHDAIELGYLLKTDIVVSSKDEQIKRAKDVALARLQDFQAIPQRELLLPGKGAYYVVDDQINGMLKAKKLTEHSARIARHQAHILTGGDRANPATPVDEGYILELEREAFVALCGTVETQERVAFMLKNGKPLIN
ncbi:MAG: 3-hydroxyacyl-CoA dehydrogenase/enoyl-CoA hydratase family protein [Acidobacteria bacterium]|nr:3-hydroxyacyl-CoA dehydrogenase/enoyl-CoA hydratase family protein [Acidobacteriota bacterium]